MENSSFVSDSEWNRYINLSIAELRDILTSKVGEDYFATSQTYQVVSGQEEYALPANFYKLLWVEQQLDSASARYKKMQRFEISEMSDEFESLGIGTSGLKYRLRANNLIINSSTFGAGRTIRLWYVPANVALSANGDTVDGFNGWEEFIILKSARKALVKEEQDVSDLDIELKVFYDRLESMAPSRDQAQPMRIQDNTKRYSRDELWH